MAIQPIVRGWFGRQFVAWKRANDNLGTTMNKVVRGYLARCKFKRMLAAHFHKTVVIPAVVVIQCMVRCSVARILLKQYKHEKWILEEEVITLKLNDTLAVINFFLGILFEGS